MASLDSPFAPQHYLDLQQTEWPEFFAEVLHAWEILPLLGGFFSGKLGPQFVPGHFGKWIGSPVIGEQVYVGAGTVIEPGAYIKGPAWIGENCQIRHGAYIRENVIVGAGSVIGNSSEIKNSFLFKDCQVPHFNYVGDSILGYKTHLAAGVILSNLKLNGDMITVRSETTVISTGLRKFGAILGDYAEVGCNAVLNPGSIVGRKSLIYPGVAWRGVMPANSIAKDIGQIRPRRVAE